MAFASSFAEILDPWSLVGSGEGTTLKTLFYERELVCSGSPAARSGMGQKGTDEERNWSSGLGVCGSLLALQGLAQQPWVRGPFASPHPLPWCNHCEPSCDGRLLPCHGPTSHEATSSGEQNQSLRSTHCLPCMCQVPRGEGC